MYDTSSPKYDLVNIFQKIISESNLISEFIKQNNSKVFADKGMLNTCNYPYKSKKWLTRFISFLFIF